MHHAPEQATGSMSHSPTRPGGHDETALLQHFFTRLHHVPLADWIEAAVPTADGTFVDRYESDEARAARRRLRDIADRYPAAVNLARARVQHFVTAAEGFTAPSIVARMKRVALTAALALVARPHLSRDDFELLYGPFATLIPPDHFESSR
ncbi:MAG TPA: hypothetical protein VMM18_14400 [Gemmatimonadaceae bacterium]|nr:hypothetical protein [Gemmatimonadaceae bacterium]